MRAGQHRIDRPVLVDLVGHQDRRPGTTASASSASRAAAAVHGVQAIGGRADAARRRRHRPMLGGQPGAVAVQPGTRIGAGTRRAAPAAR